MNKKPIIFAVSLSIILTIGCSPMSAQAASCSSQAQYKAAQTYSLNNYPNAYKSTLESKFGNTGTVTKTDSLFQYKRYNLCFKLVTGRTYVEFPYYKSNWASAQRVI